MSNNKSTIKTDVLIIGAGLAGLLSAISAAEAGAEVTLVSSGTICSGSSFYPGTWGFGLVGPENQEDEKDLVDTIMQAGCQMPDRKLVGFFVSHINESISYLEQIGVPLKRADNPEEREFIPCFDHKTRSWHGIVKEEAKPVFQARLKALGVQMLPHTEVTELRFEKAENPVSPSTPRRVTGAVAVKDGRELVEFCCSSLVIATGGLGGLYRYRLNPGDVTGMGQYLALTAGAKLVNLEFMQMMPGFLSPAYGTVFNEKIFRYTCSPAYDGWEEKERQELLELRSGHGPYSSRLESGRVDEALTAVWAKEPGGVVVSYTPELKNHQPEFVRTYFDWLEREKHLTVDDPVRLGIFAHASNGGIQIDENGFTGIPGLYACGEATGGMHGADRLGGLSTANGLVFGRAAGTAAARAAHEVSGSETKNPPVQGVIPTPVSTQSAEQVEDIQTVKAVRMELKTRMSACAMIDRSEARCAEMLAWLSESKKRWCGEVAAGENLNLYLEQCRLRAEIMTATCMMHAIRLRKESRGSHHRNDYPAENPELAHRIIVDIKNITNV